MSDGDLHDRRKEDQNFSEFIGEMRQWKITSEEWRKDVDGKLEEVVGFMSEIRTPRKLVIWTVRAFAVAAVGVVATGVVAWLKGHIRIN